MQSLLCDQVLRRFDPCEADRESHRLDHVDLRWDECHRRALSKRTHGERPVRLLLRLGAVLRDGDVIADTADCLLVVRVIPCPVLVIRPMSPAKAALAGLELGNLHVPVEISEHEILTPADGPARGVLDGRGIACTLETRVFHPTPINGVTWTAAAGGLRINSPAGARVFV